MATSAPNPLLTLAVFGLIALAVVGLAFWWLKPEPRTMLIWGFSIVVGMGVTGALLFKFHRDQQQVERLARDGIPGVATILRIDSTNVLVNRRPQVQLKLRVALEGRAPYELEHITLLPLGGHGAAPNRVVPVRVDPADPQQMLFDWGAAPPPEPASGGDAAERLKKLEALRRQNLISAEEYDAQRQRILTEL